MEIVHVKGIVIAENQLRENDKMLTVFSDKHGKISVSAKGAKKSGSKFVACTQIFCYSDMELYCGKSHIYTLKDAELLESFYDLRTDIDKLMVASDIIRLTSKVIQEELADEEVLRLLLNTLYYLSKGEKLSPELLFCIYRVRLVYLQGYFPLIRYKHSGTKLAIDHICNSAMEKLFKFSVSEDVLHELGNICEKIVKEMLEGI